MRGRAAEENHLLKIASEMDAENLWQHLRALESLDKLSGSSGAGQAVDYLSAQLKKLHIDHEVEEFDALLSNPLTASVEISGRPFEVHARPRSFSASCPEGQSGDLIYDPYNREKAPWKKHAEFLRQVRGKLVVSHGFDERYAKTLERYGAAGWIQVWDSPEEQVHEDTAGPVWGTPTVDTSYLLPLIPIAGVNAQDGDKLIREISKGKCRAALRVEVDTKAARLRMPVARIEGKRKDFVLLSCHYDSWYKGAFDNCASNAAALEIARILKNHEKDLVRGVRIAWWAGHSNGRYAGSAWYCDHHFHELKQSCAAHVTSDLIGSRYGNLVGARSTGIEGQDFIASAVRLLDPAAPVLTFPIGRGADQSFWGADIPIHFYTRYERKAEEKESTTPGPGVFWWHTAEDTLDKVDPEVLAKDAKLLLLNIWRLAALPRLPFNTGEYFSSIQKELAAHPEEDAARDFGELRERVREVEKLTEKVLAGADDGQSDRILKLVGGVLNRLRYMYGSAYGQDLIFEPFGRFPRLCDARKREDLTPEEYLFVYTDYIRKKNRFLDETAILLERIHGIFKKNREKKLTNPCFDLEY